MYLKCTTITNNIAGVGAGGGVFLDGGSVDAGYLTAELVEVTISGNTAQTDGGGLSSNGNAMLGITKSVVSSNSALGRGGGVHLSGANADTVNSTTIEESLISGNMVGNDAAVVPQDGGGVWAGYTARVGIHTTTIEGNTAALNGGGIHVQSTAEFALTDSTVSLNEAINGGGVSVIRTDALILQSTLYANRALRNGGGLYALSNGLTTVNLAYSTLSLNSAAGSGLGRGGGIYSDSLPTPALPLAVSLDHTIVSTNLGAPLGGFDEVFDAGSQAGFPTVWATFSLLRDNVGTLFNPGFPDPHGNIIGSANAPIDAQLGPLADNGGPTLTMMPSNTSPVINAGNPNGAGTPMFDQRGAPFVRENGVVDMGSLEVQPPPPTPDFNGDGVADCDDINALSLDIALGLNSPQFDLTGDGFTNLLDLDKWLDDAPDVNGLAIERYLHGDANLDTSVDGVDFIIWNTNKFTLSADWCKGDFNADGVINGQDFVIWNINKFTQSPPLSQCALLPATASMLEPEVVDLHAMTAVPKTASQQSQLAEYRQAVSATDLQETGSDKEDGLAIL